MPCRSTGKNSETKSGIESGEPSPWQSNRPATTLGALGAQPNPNSRRCRYCQLSPPSPLHSVRFRFQGNPRIAPTSTFRPRRILPASAPHHPATPPPASEAMPEIGNKTQTGSPNAAGRTGIPAEPWGTGGLEKWNGQCHENIDRVADAIAQCPGIHSPTAPASRCGRSN